MSSIGCIRPIWANFVSQRGSRFTLVLGRFASLMVRFGRGRMQNSKKCSIFVVKEGR